VRPSLPVRLAIALGVVVALLAGLWVASGLLAPTYLTSIIFGFVWFLIASVVLGKAVKGRPELKWTVRGPFLATAVLGVIAFAWTSLRDKEVHENVATGVPVSAAAGPPVEAGTKPTRVKRNISLVAGRFHEADEGSAKGKATVIALAKGGRVLTLTGFEVNNGPDLRVYLVPGDGVDTGDHLDLGGLKGNVGDQQYKVPAETDLGRYKTVVIWCRAFSVAFARAPLKGV
jgi:hypothetical protein